MKAGILQKAPSSRKDTQKALNPALQAGLNCIPIASIANMGTYSYIIISTGLLQSKQGAQRWLA